MHTTKMMFGGAAGGDQSARGNASKNNQTVGETVTVTTGRRMKGPKNHTGLASFHLINGAGSSPVGTLTMSLSNLPDPDPAVEAHWHDGALFYTSADTATAGIDEVDLSTPVNNMYFLIGCTAEWVRFQVTMASGSASVVLWARADGED